MTVPILDITSLMKQMNIAPLNVIAEQLTQWGQRHLDWYALLNMIMQNGATAQPKKMVAGYLERGTYEHRRTQSPADTWHAILVAVLEADI